MPLQWSTPRPPTKGVSHYDHVVAETPLGPIMLEWKSWKETDSPCGHMPWGEFIVALNLDDAKAEAQHAWDRKATQVAALASASAREAQSACAHDWRQHTFGQERCAKCGATRY